MMEFLTRLFGSTEPSGKVAKQRLQLVLVNDRTNLSPQMLVLLKEDLIAVISKYMEIDEEGLEVNLDRSEEQVALVANIPIRKVRRPLPIPE
ncbi:MAG: cell division topological specificity factor MinE [Betaproteobacteria bacterium]